MKTTLQTLEVPVAKGNVQASGDKYTWGCLMVDFPEKLAEQVQAWTLENVPDEVLYLDPEDPTGYGRETHVHTTVAYGLDPKMDQQLVKDIVDGLDQPIRVRLGRISKFEPDKYDVLKVEVDSPDLHALHELVKALGVPGETYPDYKPHLTLAYVEKGAADHLLDQNPFEGLEFYLTQFNYSAPPEPGAKDTHTKYEIRVAVKASGPVKFWLEESGEFHTLPMNDEHWDYPAILDRYENEPGGDDGDARNKMAFDDGWVRGFVGGTGLYIQTTKADVAKALKALPQELKFVPELIVETTGEGSITAGGIRIPVLEGEDALDAWTHRKDVRHRVAASTGKFWLSPEGDVYFAGQDHYEWVINNKETIAGHHGGAELIKDIDSAVDTYSDYDDGLGDALEQALLGGGWTRVDSDSIQGAADRLSNMKAFVNEYILKTDRETVLFVNLVDENVEFEGRAMDFMRWNGKPGAQTRKMRGALTRDQAKEAVGESIGEALAIAMVENPQWVFPSTEAEGILNRTLERLDRWGAFEAYAQDNFGIPFRAHRVFAGADLVFVDRYDALGISRPEPGTCCKGQCEGTGIVPVCYRQPAGLEVYLIQEEEDPELIRLWEAAEAQEPSEDGWHFVPCPDCKCYACGGSGHLLESRE